MKDETGVRGSFHATPGIEKAADAYLASCREILLTSDPSLAEMDRPHLIQATVNMALQQMMYWSKVQRDAEDPDMIPSQALVGAFAGLGIALAMFGYDPEEVLHQCLPTMMRAWCDACAEKAPDGPALN